MIKFVLRYMLIFYAFAMFIKAIAAIWNSSYFSRIVRPTVAAHAKQSVHDVTYQTVSLAVYGSPPDAQREREVNRIQPYTHYSSGVGPSGGPSFRNAAPYVGERRFCERTES